MKIDAAAEPWMKTVLHYKTNFLNASETFIHRLISSHRRYTPSALCLNKLQFGDEIQIHKVPASGLDKWINQTAFHMNIPLPFYKRVIRQVNPNVVHAHFGYDGYKLLQICEKADIPLLISFYGSDVSRLPDELFWRSRYKNMAKSRATFVAASDFMKNQLIELGFPPSKIHIVRFGLNLSRLSVKETHPPIQKWMMVGRLVEKKGFDTALKAAKLLADNGRDFTITIFGDGPLKSNLMDLRNRLGLENKVTFSGYQPIGKIAKAHKSHGLLIAPSITAEDGDMEGLPNTILEAMALGTPVVSTPHAAIPEVIKHSKTGFLSKERDSVDLAQILTDILDGRFNLNTIRSNARQTIEQYHDVKTMVSNIEDIYDKIS